ncbi:MAG TPA: hypothetical protein VN043_08470 [Rhodanobacter sp.]|nr:hypothetical protein [Rhodanobacter sp.]
MTTELSPKLSAHLSALDVPPSGAATETAQRKLESRLSRTRPAAVRRPWLGWATAAATSCLVLALVLLPASQGIAFAAVQKHLRDFTTLSLTIEQRSQGMAMPSIHVRMNRHGDARTDMGGATTTVVNAGEHRILTLLHDSHMAMLTPLPIDASAQPAGNLAWLDAIRHFQGKATQLPDKRIIDGRPTTGWTLDTEGMHITLWADSDGLPRAIEINGGKQLSQRMHVSIDQPMDASIFSTQVPAGYHLMRPDAE